MNADDSARLLDYPFMLRVVVAAWDVLEHCEENDGDPDDEPYATLKRALVALADRGMEKQK